jgi:hypothetical protein
LSYRSRCSCGILHPSSSRELIFVGEQVIQLSISSSAAFLLRLRVKFVFKCAFYVLSLIALDMSDEEHDSGRLATLPPLDDVLRASQPFLNSRHSFPLLNLVTRRPLNLEACLLSNMPAQDSSAKERMVQKDTERDCMAQGFDDLNLTKVFAHAMIVVQAIPQPIPRWLAVPLSSCWGLYCLPAYDSTQCCSALG